MPTDESLRRMDARDRRIARGRANPELIPHGTEGGYINWGCHEVCCKSVATAATLARRAARKERARAGRVE